MPVLMLLAGCARTDPVLIPYVYVCGGKESLLTPYEFSQRRDDWLQRVQPLSGDTRWSAMRAKVSSVEEHILADMGRLRVVSCILHLDGDDYYRYVRLVACMDGDRIQPLYYALDRCETPLDVQYADRRLTIRPGAPDSYASPITIYLPWSGMPTFELP